MIDLPRPQDHHPDLTEERLAVLGQIVATYHNSAVRSERPEEGDGPWSTGCRAYDRVKFGIGRAKKEHPWLTLQKEGSLAFWFCVGQCPMRICKPEQLVAVHPREQLALKRMAEQLAIDVPGLGVPTNAALRVEKQIVGRFVRVVFLNLVSQDGETLYKSWMIYEAKDEGGQVLGPDTPPPPPHDPGRAPVSPKGTPGADDSADATEPDASSE